MSSLVEKVTQRKFVRIRERNQITLPAEMLEGTSMRAGDFVEVSRTEGGLVLKPTILVTVDSPEAARQQALADDDIREKRYETFNSAGELIDAVKRRRKKEKRPIAAEAVGG